MARLNHQAVRNSQYALTHNWSFILLNLPTGLSGFSDITGENGVLNLHCETSDIPNAAVIMAEAKIRGIVVKQPSESQPDGQFTATFFEKDDYSISKFFDSWRQLGADRRTMIQHPKSEALVFDGCQMHLLDGEGNVKAKYRPLNVFPSNVILTPLASDGDFHRCEVVFDYTTFDRLDENDVINGGNDRP